MGALLVLGLVAGALVWAGSGSDDTVLAQTTGGPAVAVPRTTGLTVEEAGRRLEEVGLAIGDSTTLPSVEVPRGAVLGTDPSAGTDAPGGSPVDLVISSGPDATAVPNLVGEQVGAARSVLRESGLTLGDVLEVPSTSPRGTVIESAPGFGEVRPEGTVVDLVVADGTNLVPPVVGLSQGEAVGQVTGAGFEVEVQERQSDEAGGLVLEVAPEASTSQRLGATITLVVSASADSAPVRVTQTAYATTTEPAVRQTATTTATTTTTTTATTTATATTTTNSTATVTSAATVTATTTVTEPADPPPAAAP